MPSALGAYPELIGCPRHAGSGIAHVHLRTAALAPDLKLAHARDSTPMLSHEWPAGAGWCLYRHGSRVSLTIACGDSGDCARGGVVDADGAAESDVTAWQR